MVSHVTVKMPLPIVNGPGISLPRNWNGVFVSAREHVASVDEELELELKLPFITVPLSRTFAACAIQIAPVAGKRRMTGL
jgi:hypothetical protein